MFKRCLSLLIMLVCVGLASAAREQVKRGIYHGSAGVNKMWSSRPVQKAPLRVKGGPELWGVVEYSSAWDQMEEGQAPYGIYSFLATSPSETSLVADMAGNMPNGGGVFIGDTFHFMHFELMYETVPVVYYNRYNTGTWQPENYPSYQNAQTVATDIAYDSSTGYCYAYYYNPASPNLPNEFCQVQFGEYGPSAWTICTDETIMVALTSDSDGQLYGIDWEGGLYKIDKNTGVKTLVDYTGIRASTYRQSAAYDSRSGKIYWAAFMEDDEGVSSALYIIDPETARATKAGDFADAMEVTTLHIPAPLAEDNAPAAPTDVNASFGKGSLEGTISFRLPSETYGGEALEGDLDYTVTVNGEEALTGSGAAGSPVTRTLAVEQGETVIVVTASNREGKGAPSGKVIFFAGFDTPLPVRDVTLEIDEDGYAILEWNVPEGTVNGGYLDKDNLTYGIVRYPGEVKVAGAARLCIFTEKLPQDGYNKYYYSVTATQHGISGEAVASNKVQVGEACEVPFIDDFSTDDLYDLYTVVTGSEGSPSWSPSYRSFVIFYGNSPSDSWLMTPPVRLKGGETYHFEYDLRTGSNYDTERFSTAYGTGETPADYKVIRQPESYRSGSYNHFKETVVPETDGIYHFAIHACSDGFKSGMYVTNISIKLDAAPDVPGQVTAIGLTPGQYGASEVKISFKAPSVDINGKELAEIESIMVSRMSGEEEVPVHIFSNPAVGETLECTDSDMPAGSTVYKFIAKNSYGRGAEATAEVWAGADIPQPPAGARITETENGIIISWDKTTSETGMHNGWVDTEKITYSIYDNAGEVVAKGITGDSFLYHTDMNRTNVLYFQVKAVSATGESTGTGTRDYVIGRAAGLPFTESFPKGLPNGKNLWWTRGKSDFNSFSITPGISSDNDHGCAYWLPVVNDDYAYMNSGRISAGGTAHATLLFSYYCTPGAHLGIEAIADICQEKEIVLSSDNCIDKTGEPGWRQVIVTLPGEVTGADWFLLKFRAFGDREISNPRMYVDDIRLIDFKEHDLSVVVTAPSVAVMGQPFTGSFSVSNTGWENLADVTVELKDGQETVASAVIGSLPFNTSDTVELTYVPEVGAERYVTLSAAATASGVTATADHHVTAVWSSLPTVCDLRADNGNLIWSDPSSQPYSIIETFDHYLPWSTESAGSWTMFDGDGVVTNAYTLMSYPHIGEKLGFMLFNNTYATMSIEQRLIFTPESGNQCMLAVANVHEYGKGIECEDWLISPVLSGDAQTVEFSIKSLTDYEEDFAIYISRSDNNVETLRQNRLVFEKFGAGNQWRRHKYDLPEGTTHFAIVYTSNLSGVMVDNVRFDAAKPVVNGYNIYRNGELAASAGAGSTSWALPSGSDAASGSIYTVTVVYDEGESGFSNEVDPAAASIGNVAVRDCGPGCVFTVTGINLGQIDPSDLQPGFYIIDGKKVYVK